MFLGHPFEFWYTWLTLGVGAAHKLVEIAQSFAAATKSTKDDAVVGVAVRVLEQADGVLGYLPALRMKVSK